MRKPGTQTHAERTGGSGTKKATHDDEQTRDGRFTKHSHPEGKSEKPSPTELERGRTTERAPQLERDQPAEKHVPTDPSP